jgi:hypothetical protein
VTLCSKAGVCSLSLTEIAVSNPAGGMDVCLMSVVCCQVKADSHIACCAHAAEGLECVFPI